DGKRPPTRYVREFKQHPAATAYILSDNRQTATLRARIRLNRHHLRSRLHTLDSKIDARCPHCLALNDQAAPLGSVRNTRTRPYALPFACTTPLALVLGMLS